MFGSHKAAKENSEDTQRQIFEAKIKIKTLMTKVNGNLQAELSVARSLKKAGKKSPENYSRIGINYYLLQALQRAEERLSDIESSNELSETMSALGSVLGSVNALGQKQTKVDAGSIFSGIGKMNKAKEKESGRLQGMLRDIGNASSTSARTDDLSQLMGLDVIENLINGTGVSEKTVDEHVEEDILSQIYNDTEKEEKPVTEELDIEKLIENL